MAFRNRVREEIARRQFIGVPLEVLEHVKDLDESRSNLLGTPIVLYRNSDNTYVCNCIVPDKQDNGTCRLCSGSTV